ncbi:hypothetical protein FRC01_004756 [Tulasnella sp. 417]|nr:hypothetical protein FRC01_004756 [Tulasnella sp. 417]
MGTKHPVIWAEVKHVENQALGKPVDEEVQLTILSLFALSFNIDIFYDKVIRWITILNQLFSEIKSDELLDVFYSLKAQRQQFKEYLQNIPSLMPVALDAWTSSKYIAFLAIVGTFIMNDWKLEEMHGAHDGRIWPAASGTVQELDMLHMILALMANNASNNGTLASKFTKIVKTLSESDSVTMEI